MLERNEISIGLGGQYVDLYGFPDGRLEVRWKNLPLSYTVFDKDQRVSHTAIVENKRLGEALAFIKAQQDVAYSPKVKTNSEKDGYRKKGRDAPAPAASGPWSSAPADPTGPQYDISTLHTM